MCADVAMRYSDVISLGEVVQCFDRHGLRLAINGYAAEAAVWLSRAHQLHLQMPPGFGYVRHLVSACRLRFRCGHPAKAIETLHRANACSALTLTEEHRGAWTMRAHEAGMLWLTGKEAEAAVVAERVLDIGADKVDPETMRMLLMVMVAHPLKRTSDTAFDTLLAWREAPNLAHAYKDRHWQDEEEARVLRSVTSTRYSMRSPSAATACA